MQFTYPTPDGFFNILQAVQVSSRLKWGGTEPLGGAQAQIVK